MHPLRKFQAIIILCASCLLSFCINIAQRVEVSTERTYLVRIAFICGMMSIASFVTTRILRQILQ